MLKNDLLAKSVRFALIGGAATAALTAAPVIAAEEEKVERIEVTGSRIKRVDLETVSPVTVITRENIELSGDSNVSEVLRNTSSNSFGSFKAQSGYGSGQAATNEVNLRGLGAGATLVLMDGRRLPGVGNNGGSVTDLSTIPLAIVERIEIIRDGASAVYGSDAVAGVINIITKKEQEGVYLGFATESPEVDGGNQKKFELSMGASTDKGNLVVVAEYSTSGEITDAAVTGFDNGISSYSPVARFQINDKAHADNGSTFFNEEICGQVENTSNQESYCGYAYSNATWLFGSTRRGSLMVKGDYELTENITFNGRVGLGLNDTHTRYAPTPVSTSLLTIDADNALNPYGVDGLVRFRTALNGPRDAYTQRNHFDAVLGLEGTWDVNGGVDWELNYQKIIGSENVKTRNLVKDSVIQDAIDNEELDLFNVANLGFDEWVETTSVVYAEANHTGLYETTQDRDIFDGNISSQLFESDFVTLSGVVGFDYETFDFEQISDPESSLGGVSGGSGGDDVYANRKRTSYFGEVVAELPANIEVSLAARYDKYEQEGNVGAGNIVKAEFTNTSPKIGVSWRPLDSLLIRASHGDAFRAPTMNEMFASRSFGFPDAYDPYYCDTLGNSANDTTYCNESNQPQHLTYYGGNVDLKPEESTQSTLGFVWSATDELSFEVGYYNIEYTDKIVSLSPDTILTLENQNGGSSPNVVRGSDGKVVSIQSGYINLNSVETSGLDYSATYSLESDFGDFNFSMDGSYVLNYEETDEDGTTDYTGDIFYPKLRANLTTAWSMDDIFASWHVSLIGKQDNKLYYYYDKHGTHVTHNVQVGYHLPYNSKITVGARNLFSKDAPFLAGGGWRDINFDIYDPTGRTVFLKVETKF